MLPAQLLGLCLRILQPQEIKSHVYGACTEPVLLQEKPVLFAPAGLEGGCEQHRHTGSMRLDFKMGSACLALLDDRSDHCLETVAVTLQVGGALTMIRR